MKKNFFLLIIVFLLSGCSSTLKEDTDGFNEHGIPLELEEEIIEVINLDETAVNTKNVDLAISNYSSKNLTSNIKETQTEAFKYFEDFGVSLSVHNIEVIYIKENEAIVKTLNKYRTSEFNHNNNIQNDNYMLHFLIKEDDNKWKFNYSYIVKRIFLNEDGNLDIENKNFQGWDESENWDKEIKKIKEQNALPSQFIKENSLN